MSTAPPDIKLLQCSVDATGDSEFRLLVDGTTVKYITIAPGIWTDNDLCFEPTLISLLPPFPKGDWNTGHIDRNTETGMPHFAWTTKKRLPGLKNCWHPTHIDHLEFSYGEHLRSEVREATSSRFDAIVIVKFARFVWEIPAIDSECLAYQWINGHGIGPKFLGILTEEGRAIGFVIEKIDDARHAEIGDLAACQQALKKLHKLGILHGDINKFNFLIANDQATLIDFDFAQKEQSDVVLEEEFQRLPDMLTDTSWRGGCPPLTPEWSGDEQVDE